MAANVPARLKPIDIECVVYTGIDHQIEPRAIVVRLGCHLAAGVSPVRIIRLADKDQSRCSQSCRAAAARRMIGDRRTEPLEKATLNRIALNGRQRRTAAHRLTQHRDPAWVDYGLLRKDLSDRPRRPRT
jgi:hypothetical protein